MNLIETVKAAPWSAITPASAGGATTFTTIVVWALSILLYVAGALAVIYLIYSGILYITAAGNPDNAKKGQQGIVNAIIGIVVIVLAYVIVAAISNLGNSKF